MKKIISLILSLITVLSICLFSACDNGATSSNTNDSSQTDIGNGEQTAVEVQDKTFYMGMFGIAPESKQDTMIKFEDAVNGDLYNVFMMPQMTEEKMDLYCQMIYDNGKKFWLYAMDTVWVRDGLNLVVRQDAYKRLNDLRNQYAGKPWYDALLGLHIDEPLLQAMPLKELYEGSKAINFVFPEKRFWVNFAGFAFNEDLSSTYERMTVEAGEYITDLSYDLYGQMNETILDTWHNMVNMFKGKGKYFWGVPMTMAYAARCTEEQCIEHVQTFYELIKNTKGGAGLLLYTGGTFSWDLEQIGNIGYYDLQVSTEEFKTWATRKKPWIMYYERFYDASGNPINGGFKPWTNLAKLLQDVADEMSVLNGERVQKIDTEIIVENNQVFEYNGGGQSPKVYPDYLSYTYAFKMKGEDIVFEEAPSEIGEYEVVITLPESKFRKKKTVKANFSIVESTKTLISPKDIVENYTSNRSWIKINRSGLTYSFDDQNYIPYEKGTEIDVTELITRNGYSNCIWFKEGEKTAFAYPVKSYKEVTVFDFEGAQVDIWSTFTLASNKKYAGTQSAYCKKENAVIVDGGLTHMQHFYFNTCNLPADPATHGYNLSNAHYLEFWIYAEEEIKDFRVQISDAGWVGTRFNQSYDVPAKQWVKLTYNFADRVNIENTPLKSMIMMDFVFDKNVDFYIDNIVALVL